MIREVKEFFDRLEEKDQYKYFLFRKFYSNPKCLLNKNKEDIKKGDYFDLEIAKAYMFDNDFLDLLYIAFDDEKFRKKLNYTMLSSLDEIIIRSVEITNLNVDNFFSSEELYELIKSHIKERELYKEKNIIKKMKKYNTNFANCFREEVILKEKVILYASKNDVDPELKEAAKKRKILHLKVINNDN